MANKKSIINQCKGCNGAFLNGCVIYAELRKLEKYHSGSHSKIKIVVAKCHSTETS